MKKSILLLSLATIIFGSCNNAAHPENEVSTQIPGDTIIPAAKNATADNSSNSLDWQGTYTGIVPCADCEGIATSITLGKNKSYISTKKYLGKNKVTQTENRGTFNWNKDGNTITLVGLENAPAQYLVGEHKLIQLDMKGNRITGALSSNYELKKIN